MSPILSPDNGFQFWIFTILLIHVGFRKHDALILPIMFKEILCLFMHIVHSRIVIVLIST